MRDLLLDALRRADDGLLAGSYRALSVTTDSERARLRAARRPFADPEALEPVPLQALDATADWLVERAARPAGQASGLMGLAGALGVAPEALGLVWIAVRLAQRLAIVYGFDPHSDPGRMVLWRALAAAFELELPEGGRVGMRASELPALFAPRRVRPRTVGSELAGQMVRRAAHLTASRRTRSGERIRVLGHRMRDVFRRLSDAPGGPGAPPEDAREV